MTRIAGADGCPGGWIVALRDTEGGPIQLRRVSELREVLETSDAPAVLCVDIPIGLLDEAVPGGRECDRDAREFLGPARSCSVFSPPVRAVLETTSYPTACATNRASSPHELAISQQCYRIVAKIREVDELMTPELQHRVREVHPEVCFAELNGGRGVESSKHEPDGRHERLELLEQAFGTELASLVAARGKSCNVDDVLDALAACWTAQRVLSGAAERFPAEPPRDSRGLRMEIVR